MIFFETTGPDGLVIGACPLPRRLPKETVVSGFAGWTGGLGLRKAWLKFKQVVVAPTEAVKRFDRLSARRMFVFTFPGSGRESFLS